MVIHAGAAALTLASWPLSGTSHHFSQIRKKHPISGEVCLRQDGFENSARVLSLRVIFFP